MISNRTLAIIGFGVLGFLLYRSEQRMDRIEEKLDDIIQTRETVAYTEQDIDCLTKNIYYEAGVEDRAGKYAVAHVTVNRLKTGYWGNNICKVVYSKSQFSWTLDKKLPKPNKTLWAESREIAEAVLNGHRVRGLHRSLFYHADYIKTPKWADANERITQIGQHIFYNKARNSWLTL